MVLYTIALQPALLGSSTVWTIYMYNMYKSMQVNFKSISVAGVHIYMYIVHSHTNMEGVESGIGDG